MDIKLKVKLSAYSKLPILDYVADVPFSEEDIVYGRVNGAWIPLEGIGTSDIVLAENSGLELTPIDKHHRELKIKQYIGTEPEAFEEDTTYYIIENNPDFYANGGTAFSDGYEDFGITNEYDKNINGGKAGTITISLTLLPINAKGVLNG